MNRDEAIEALELLRSVVRRARDDTAVQNWGRIWMLHGISNGCGFVATDWLLWRGHATPMPFVLLWVPILAFNLATVPLLKRRRSGVPSFVEKQIWTIWTSFVVAVVVMAYLNYFMGLETLFVGPAIAVLAAVAFSSLASIVGPVWYGAAAVFVAVAVLMSLLPNVQFVILGVVWAATKVSAGFVLERAKRRRLARTEAAAPEVV